MQFALKSIRKRQFHSEKSLSLLYNCPNTALHKANQSRSLHRSGTQGKGQAQIILTEPIPPAVVSSAFSISTW